MPNVPKAKLQLVAKLLRDLDRYLDKQTRDSEVVALRQRIAEMIGSGD